MLRLKFLIERKNTDTEAVLYVIFNFIVVVLFSAISHDDIKFKKKFKYQLWLKIKVGGRPFFVLLICVTLIQLNSI